MKDITLNPLDVNQRKLLQFGVVLILLLFLCVYFFLNRETKSEVEQENTQIVLEDSQLRVFDDTYTFTGYPDEILIHYPYFILVQAGKPLSTIYNLETKQKELEISDILLDYHDGNILVNKKETFFNDINLGQYCDSAFIKSNSEILCITKKTKNSVDNMLISINPEQPNLWKQVYQSKNVLTNVIVVNDIVYIGEIDFESKQNYLTIDEQTRAIDVPVNVVYPMNGEVYFASFPSALNEGMQSYYLLDNAQPVDKNKIHFFIPKQIQQ